MVNSALPWSCLGVGNCAPRPVGIGAGNAIPSQMVGGREIHNFVVGQPAPQVAPKTFAQALTNACDLPLSQLPVPCLKGDDMAVLIPEDEYQAGLESCKSSLHGRIILPKGTTPPTVVQLREKLRRLWSPLTNWTMVPIGRGFFDFTFSSVEDMRRVLAVGSWSLSPGSLRLFAWTPDFNPSRVKQTSTQIWVRLLGLPKEYWRPKIIFAIARGVGVPLSLDDATINRVYGHFARVLVDVDLSGDLRDRVMVERENFAFYVDVQYERLPSFCQQCKLVGHDISHCKRREAREGVVQQEGQEGRRVVIQERRRVRKEGPVHQDQRFGANALEGEAPQGHKLASVIVAAESEAATYAPKEAPNSRGVVFGMPRGTVDVSPSHVSCSPSHVQGERSGGVGGDNLEGVVEVVSTEGGLVGMVEHVPSALDRTLALEVRGIGGGLAVVLPSTDSVQVTPLQGRLWSDGREQFGSDEPRLQLEDSGVEDTLTKNQRKKISRENNMAKARAAKGTLHKGGPSGVKP